MTTDQICPKCGTARAGNALQGLCPKCLGDLAFGLSKSLSQEGNGSDFGGWRRLGDYELLEEIARGGMGVVFKARQQSLNRIVALKVLLNGPFSSDAFVRRFRTEAGAVAALRHPNIVTIFEFGEQHGHHFFSMEYIDGKAFSEVAREKPLPAARAAAYLKTIAEAIHYAHHEGILHRDLKPSNILLDPFDQPRVTDFGLAKLLNTNVELTNTGQILGSPTHMPPEQAAGKFAETGPASDVYSLGAILYHLLTGRPPFQGETLPEILFQVQNAQPIAPRRLNPSVPVDLQTICLKCLQKDPARRYPTAKMLADDLGRFLENRPILARPVTLPEKAWLWCKRRPVLAALTMALILAVFAGLTGILWQWRRAELHAQGETRNRRLAEESASTTRLNLYAADVSLAFRAIHDGDYGLARKTLAALLPGPRAPDLRGFELYYLWHLCEGQQLATFKGHEWIVTCAAFSPDGKLVVTGSQDGTARIWDVDRRECVRSLPVGGAAVWSCAFTPDGALLMTANSGGKVEFRATNTWKVTTNFPGKIASLSTTGTLVAISQSNPFFWENSGEVSVWNYRTGARITQLEKPGRMPVLSPDNQFVAVAGLRNGIDLYELNSARKLRHLPTENPVWSLNFSPDGKFLIGTGWSSDILLWDLSSDGPPRKLLGHSLTVWTVAFSPDGSTILTTGSDQSVRLWDAATLQPKIILHGHDSEVWCGTFSPDGKLVVSGGKDQNVMLWPVKLTKARDEVPNVNKEKPFYSPDGNYVATIVDRGGGEHSAIWKISDRSLVLELPESRVIGFSPAPSQILTWDANQTGLLFRSIDGTSSNRVALAGVSPHRESFEHWSFSKDGEAFCAIDHFGNARLWETRTGKLLGTMKGTPGPLRNAVPGPGGSFLAMSLESENFARLYESSTGREMRLAGHHDFVSGLSFSPDGGTLATGSMDGSIRLWETRNGRQITVLPGHLEEATDVAFSPDGKTLASVNQLGSIKLWHLPTLRELIAIDFPQAGMFLQFTSNGQHLAVTTQMNSVHFLDGPWPNDTAPQPVQTVRR